MKINAADLQGAELDHLVAKAEGLEHAIHIDRNARALLSPSTLWVEAGPIIEREKIALWFDVASDQWFASVGSLPPSVPPSPSFSGATPLIAAMRAYVATRFG